MFIVVRNTKSTLNNQDYKLCRGDTVKLGRIKFKVKDLYVPSDADQAEDKKAKYRSSQKQLEDFHGNKSRIDCDDQCSQHTSEDEDQAFKTIDIDATELSARSKLSKRLNQGVPETDREGGKATRQCKFCWMGESTEANPLLSAC